MPASRDGSGYGPGSAIRSRGPSLAIRKGAIGFLMRSAGTDNHRVPHTGITRFDEGLVPVPSAALSIPDADQLARLAARGPVKVRMALDCEIGRASCRERVEIAEGAGSLEKTRDQTWWSEEIAGSNKGSGN